MKTIVPVANRVFVETYNLNLSESEGSLRTAIIKKLPEYFEYLFKVGDVVIVDIRNAIVLQRKAPGYIIAVDYDDIIGIYKDKIKEEKEDNLANQSKQSTTNRDYELLLKTFLKDITIIKDSIDRTYEKMHQMKKYTSSITEVMHFLDQYFILKNRDDIESFLFERRGYYQVLQEVLKQIHEIFDQDVQIELEVTHDPEIENFDELFVTIKCPCTSNKAEELELKLTHWHFDRFPDLNDILFEVESTKDEEEYNDDEEEDSDDEEQDEELEYDEEEEEYEYEDNKEEEDSKMKVNVTNFSEDNSTEKVDLLEIDSDSKEDLDSILVSDLRNATNKELLGLYFRIAKRYGWEVEEDLAQSLDRANELVETELMRRLSMYDKVSDLLEAVNRIYKQWEP
jgi:hypothetical protein